MSRADVRTGVLRGEQELVASFLETLAEEIPAYAGLDARQREEVRSIIVWTLRRVLDLWADGGALGEEDLRLFRGVGSVRARDGRPLPAVLRAYRVGASDFIDQVVDRFVDELDVRDVTALTRVWLAVLDQVSDAIYAGYESTGRSLGGDRDRSLRELLTDVVLGRQSSAATLRARLRELDADLPTSFDLVAVGPGVGVGTRTDLGQVAEAIAECDASEDSGVRLTALHTLVAGIGVVLLAEVDENALAAVVREQQARVARARLSVQQAPRWFRLSTHALRLAPAALSGRAVLDVGDLEVLALTAAHPEADAAGAASAVLGDVDDLVLTTLASVLRHGGASGAARELSVHPQTVRYRMRRLAATTGRDARQPWDAFVLQTAMLAAGRG